ncbi:MAG TPA: polysaccharide deacetylase family protein [Clostridia bacterium]|nr:polysaccharide deacetylase family protein [Clostridia bacterium]
MKKYYLFLGTIFLLILLLGIINWVFLSAKPKREKILSRERVNFPTATPSILSTPTSFSSPTPIALKENQTFAQDYGPCYWVPVLMYHHVMNPQKAKEIGATNLNVPPAVFRLQIDYLINQGYTVISLEEMVKALGNSSLPPKPLVLTFDDAYLDFYNQVYPLLKEKNLKATVFVISQFVGGGQYLSWQQLREMVNSGLVMVGNHTLNHLYLTQLLTPEIRNQIVSAKNILEENIGRKVEFFAYPYGKSTPEAKEILKEAGFKGAFLTTNGTPQCLAKPYGFSRIRIGATSLSHYGL